MVGRRVKAIHRHGKHLWFELDRRPWPAFHFGMTGSFRTYRDPAERPRFWRLELVFTGGVRLAFRDPRRFGRIRLQHDPTREPPIALLGPDPLLDPPSVRDLAPLLARRKAPLKAVLLDQAAFAGVGNWVADEILYQARLSPLRPASSLTAGRGLAAAAVAPVRVAPRGRGGRRLRPLPAHVAVPHALGEDGGGPHRPGRGDRPRHRRRADDRLGPEAPEVSCPAGRSGESRSAEP